MMKVLREVSSFESREHAAKVAKTDRTMSAVSRAAPANESNGAGSAPTINREISDISVGNRPLHGTNLFVTAAMRELARRIDYPASCNSCRVAARIPCTLLMPVFRTRRIS